MENKKNQFPIKVIHLINSLDIGGVETMLSNLVLYLNSNQYKVIVVSILPPGLIGRKIENLGIPIRVLSKKSELKILILFRLIRIILREKPLILHCHLFHANIMGRIVGKLLNVPIIISSIYSESLEGRKKEMMVKFTNFCSDKIIINSMLALRKLIEMNIVPTTKAEMIYCGIDIKRIRGFNFSEAREEKRKELSLRSNQPIIISVGHLEKVKGYTFLIESMSILKKKYPDLICLILGGGSLEEELRKQAKESNIDKNIYFLGVREDVYNFLAASDLFVISSLYEGIPIALLEAIAVGLPVVATEVGGVAEIITDGKTGFLVPAQNPKTLAQKIDYFFSLSLTERKKIIKAAGEIVEERFSIEQTAKEIENLYKMLLIKKRITDIQSP